MIALMFAALSGLAYGASDYSGAVASKRVDSVLVAAVVQVVSLAALGVVLFFYTEGTIRVEGLLWGGAAGLGSTLGLATFYRALAIGPMSVAASTTALCSAVIPVAYGLISGAVPETLALVGIGLAVPAAVLVSVGGLPAGSSAVVLAPREVVGGGSGSSQTKVLSVLAGFGFAWFFIALSQTQDDDGLYPLLGARVVSISVLVALLTLRRGFARVDGSNLKILLVAGVLDMAANAFYLLALEGDNFTWVAALSSLYPVSTVLLARVFLKESLARLQLVGLSMAGAALILVAIGH